MHSALLCLTLPRPILPTLQPPTGPHRVLVTSRRAPVPRGACQILTILGCMLPRCLYHACVGDKKKTRAPLSPSLSRSSLSRSPSVAEQLSALYRPPSPATLGDDALVTMRCKVPDQMIPGEPLLWKSPSGRIVSMKVPEGSKAGDLLEFQVPASVITMPNPDGGSSRQPSGGFVEFLKRKPSGSLSP